MIEAQCPICDSVATTVRMNRVVAVVYDGEHKEKKTVYNTVGGVTYECGTSETPSKDGVWTPKNQSAKCAELYNSHTLGENRINIFDIKRRLYVGVMPEAGFTQPPEVTP